MESICLSVTTNQHATFTVNISTLLAIHYSANRVAIYTVYSIFTCMYITVLLHYQSLMLTKAAFIWQKIQ